MAEAMAKMIYTLLLCILIQACARQDRNSGCGSMDDKGWISISEAPLNSGYYLVNDKIYSFEIELPDTTRIPELVKKHALYTMPINVSDPKTFKISLNKDGERYAKDCKNVYYATDRSYYDGPEYGIVDNEVTVLGANPKTFRYIDCGYATDDSIVYFQGLKVTGADPKTFRSLGCELAVDSNFAYIAERKIVNADRSNFKYYLFGDTVDMGDLNLWYSKIRWKKDVNIILNSQPNDGIDSNN